MSLDDYFDKVNILRDALGVMQHHDAITGTQKKHVLNDYNQLLSNSTHQCQLVMAEALRRHWEIPEKSDLIPQFCPDLNISACHVTENNNQFILTVYNPLSWTVQADIRFPVKYKMVDIQDWDKMEIPYQILPVPEHITKIPERKSSLRAELVMLTSLPPMSTSTFTVQQKEGDDPNVQYTEPQSTNKLLVIENEHISLTFNTDTGLLSAVTNKDTSVREIVSQDFYYYEAQQTVHRYSGAYVFVPKSPAPFRVAGEKKVQLKVVQGDLVQEVHQNFSSWVSQVVRLYKGSRHIELQWTVGPIDDSDRQGKEVISIFTTSLASTDTFYTDSNGREMMERTKDVRETWTYQPKDHVSGNYYPITSKIYIKDQRKNVQLTILPDRPQGGSSLGSGVVELMVHRKLLNDDGLGVGEPLNDVGTDNQGIVFTGKHYVVLDTIDHSVLYVKHLAHKVHMAPTVMFTPVSPGPHDKRVKKQEQFLTNELPQNVQVLTLDRISFNETNLFLLRLEHVFEENEDPVLSLPVEVSLENLFKPFEIVSVVETSLGGNFNPSVVKRLQWTTFSEVTPENINSPDYKTDMEPPFTIKLSPMEIRSFHIQVIKNV